MLFTKPTNFLRLALLVPFIYFCWKINEFLKSPMLDMDGCGNAALVQSFSNKPSFQPPLQTQSHMHAHTHLSTHAHTHFNLLGSESIYRSSTVSFFIHPANTLPYSPCFNTQLPSTTLAMYRHDVCKLILYSPNSFIQSGKGLWIWICYGSM